MSGPTEYRQILRSMALFTEFTEAELDSFTQLVEPSETKAGELIVHQDELGDCMFVIIQGSARVTHRATGQRFELATLGAGDFFGELALVDEGLRSADVEAVTDCMLLRIPQATIRALAGVYPSAAFKLLIAIGRVLVS